MAATHIKVQDLKSGDKFVDRRGLTHVIIQNDGTRIHYGWLHAAEDPRARYASYSVFHGFAWRAYPSKHPELGLTVSVAERKFKFGDIVYLDMNSSHRDDSGYDTGDKLVVTRQNSSEQFRYQVVNETGTYKTWVPEEDLLWSPR
jgi:hypothetical protein